MSNWSEELEKLRERIELLKQKTKHNPKSLEAIGNNIEASLEQITKFLQASEEVIHREAQENPKIQVSYDKLNQSITDLEKIIADLQVQYEALEAKTEAIKVKYAVGGALATSIASISLWKALPRVKEWLGLQT